MDLSGKNNELKVSSDEVREVEDDNSPSSGFEARSVTEVGTEHLLVELRPQIQTLVQNVVTERFFAESWPRVEPLIKQVVAERFSTESCPQTGSLIQQVIAERFSTESWPQTGSLIQQVVAERFVAELWPQIEHLFRQQVRKEVNTTIPSQIHSLLHLLSGQKNEIGEKAITGSGTLKFKLCFCNQCASIIFTNNEIKAENGEPLQVAIYDTTNSNAIVDTGPLSSAQVEFVILNEDGSNQRQEEAYSTLTDFNKSVLSPREGRRPLIVGRDVKLYLEKGVGLIKSLIITDNSSWIKSKKFRLGARIKDEKILVEFARIGEAVSQPFRVMDHRGQVNRKHHPPRSEDEVWRLEGIGKDGTYHNNLSSHGIKTVGDFLQAYYEKGSISLKKLLGKRVLEKTWKMMVTNALECGSVPTYNQSLEPTLMENVAMEGEAFDRNFEVFEQKNLGNSDDQLPLINSREELESMLNCEDPPPSLFPGEASTSYEMDYINIHTQYYQGP